MNSTGKWREKGEKGEKKKSKRIEIKSQKFHEKMQNFIFNARIKIAKDIVYRVAFI